MSGRLTRLRDFNGMSTRVGLFYALRIKYCVNCIFIFTLLVLLPLKKFFSSTQPEGLLIISKQFCLTKHPLHPQTHINHRPTRPTGPTTPDLCGLWINCNEGLIDMLQLSRLKPHYQMQSVVISETLFFER